MHLCGPGEAPHIAGIASSRRPHDSRPRPFDSHCLVPATPANRLRTSYPTAPAWQHNRHAGHFRRCRKHPARESPLFHGAATCCGQVPLRSPHARPLAAACAAYDTDVTWTDRGLGHHGLLGNESRHREPRDLPPSPTISARGLANGLTPVIIPPRSNPHIHDLRHNAERRVIPTRRKKATGRRGSCLREVERRSA